MWVMIFTNAPQAYDCDCTFECSQEGKVLFFFGKRARAVVVPADQYRYQMDRYMSGLYAAVREDAVGHSDVSWRPLADLRG